MKYCDCPEWQTEKGKFGFPPRWAKRSASKDDRLQRVGRGRGAKANPWRSLTLSMPHAMWPLGAGLNYCSRNGAIVVLDVGRCIP